MDRPQKSSAARQKNLIEPEDFCKEEGVKIPQTRIERLLAAYKKCLQAVILAKKGATRY